MHAEHAPRMSTPAAILADHLSRSSSTSSEEEEMTKTLECPPISPHHQGMVGQSPPRLEPPSGMFTGIRKDFREQSTADEMK